jgi:hypothetical protein
MFDALLKEPERISNKHSAGGQFASGLAKEGGIAASTAGTSWMMDLAAMLNQLKHADFRGRRTYHPTMLHALTGMPAAQVKKDYPIDFHTEKWDDLADIPGTTDFWAKKLGIPFEHTTPETVGRILGGVFGGGAPLVPGTKAFAGALKRAANMPPGPGKWSAQRGMVTYQGSPHKFEALDPTKIGTGQGAQTYGHGMYVAQNKGVGQRYADDLGSFDRVTGGADTAPSIATNLADELGDDLFDVLDSLRASKYTDDDGIHHVMDDGSEIIEIGNQGAWDALSAPLNKYLYEIDVPDEDIAKMLDWDAPLSEQPESVRDALSNHEVLSVAFERGASNNPTGGELYNALGGGGDTSILLNEAGIPGIKYYDGNSRAAGKGTRNFVLFDDLARRAKVLKRNDEIIEQPSVDVLHGLRVDALKASSFEDFRKDYTQQIKHGKYYHITEDPNFRIDPEKGASDTMSYSASKPQKGSLMITSDLPYWAEGYQDSRKYVAEIDMSDVPRNDYKQVGRGQGNEFFIENASKAKVKRVVPLDEAIEEADAYNKQIPQSEEELKRFYDATHAQAEPSVDEFIGKLLDDELPLDEADQIVRYGDGPSASSPKSPVDETRAKAGRPTLEEYTRSQRPSKKIKYGSMAQALRKEIKAKRDARHDLKYSNRDRLSQFSADIHQRLQWHKDSKQKAAAAEETENRIESAGGLWNARFSNEIREASNYSLGARGLGREVREAISRANMEAVPRQLKKLGWSMRHSSAGRGGRKSSRYILSPDKKYEVRLSDHYLPDTPQRADTIARGGHGWTDEIVLDGDENPQELIDAIQRAARSDGKWGASEVYGGYADESVDEFIGKLLED